MLGRNAYEWIFIGEGGETVQCSAGTTFALDDDLCELRRDDVMILCGGGHSNGHHQESFELATPQRRGLTIGGLCTAAYPMAKAGLLDRKRATIRWENQDNFAEEFLEVDLTKSVFITDGNL